MSEGKVVINTPSKGEVILNIPAVETWNITQLRYACKKNKVKGYTKMDKPQLVEAVKEIMRNMKAKRII